MDLANQIYVRKSCRNYLDDDIDFNQIRDFISSVEPLVGDIKFHYEILPKEDLNIKRVRPLIFHKWTFLFLCSA